MRALVREGSVRLTGFSAVSKSGCFHLLAPSSRLVLPLTSLLYLLVCVGHRRSIYLYISKFCISSSSVSSALKSYMPKHHETLKPQSLAKS